MVNRSPIEAHRFLQAFSNVSAVVVLKACSVEYRVSWGTAIEAVLHVGSTPAAPD